MSDGATEATARPPSMLAALTPPLLLLALIALGFLLYGDDAMGGPIQVALMVCAIVSALIGLYYGYSMETIGQGAIASITTAVGSMFILLSVGALIGTWNMSGTIATLTFYGIELISPTWFYLACVVICAGMSLAIGSSWTVAGTLGAALVGISVVLGLSPEVTAGAVISGAYFGDKLSPLSETTNLAAAIAGTDLYTHIRSMMKTTIPAIIIAAGIFTIMGVRADAEGAIDLTTAQEAISTAFTVGIAMLIPLIGVIILAVRRVPPTITIMTGALLGGIVAVIWQPSVVEAFVDEPDLPTPLVMVKGVWSAMATGFTADTGNASLDALVSGGGMASMLGTLWLILAALAFGGIMQATGQLGVLIGPIHRWARSDRKLMVATGATGIATNLVAADQYLAVVMTTTVNKEEFEARRITPQSLSRQVEDTATVTSPLVPWNSCGAYMAASLGVATIAYFPFCFFNLINPAVSFAYALLGRGIGHTEDDEYQAAPETVDMYGMGGREVKEVGRV